MSVLAIVRKELLLYFTSFLFYALTAIFLVLCGFLFFWMLTWNEAAVSGGTLAFLKPFSLFDRFEVFAKGGIDTRDVSYLLIFTATFLASTFFALDARRWRGLRS